MGSGRGKTRRVSARQPGFPGLELDEERGEEGYDCPLCEEWIPAHRERCPECDFMPDPEILGDEWVEAPARIASVDRVAF